MKGVLLVVVVVVVNVACHQRVQIEIVIIIRLKTDRLTMSSSSSAAADDLLDDGRPTDTESHQVDGIIRLDPPIELARQQAFRQATGQSSNSGNSTPVDIPTPIRESPSFDYHEERKLRFQDEIYLSHSQRPHPPAHGGGTGASRSFGSNAGGGGSFGAADSPLLRMTGGQTSSSSSGAAAAAASSSTSSTSQARSPSSSSAAAAPPPVVGAADHQHAQKSGSRDLDNGSADAVAQQPSAAAATSPPLWRGGQQVQESLELAEEARERATVAGLGRLGLQQEQEQQQQRYPSTSAAGGIESAHEKTNESKRTMVLVDSEDQQEQEQGDGSLGGAGGGKGETAGEQALRQFSESLFPCSVPGSQSPSEGCVYARGEAWRASSHFGTWKAGLCLLGLRKSRASVLVYRRLRPFALLSSFL